MLKIDDAPEFTHTVHVMTPVDGGHREDTFKARFRLLDEEEDAEPDFQSVDGIKAYLRRLVVHMDELVGADGKPIPYSDELRDRVLSMQHVRLALLRTYRKALAKERAGN